MKNVEEIEVKLTKEWTEALDKAYKNAVKDIKVDGFRKGSVPKDVYIKKFGLESLYQPAIEIALEEGFNKAKKEAKMEPVIQPSVDVVGISDSNVIFKFVFIGKPEVKLGKYKNLELTKEKVTVTKKEVEEEIKNLQNQFAESVIKDEAIEQGDTATIDFKGVVEGKELEGGSGENYPLEIGSNSFIPGFEEGLVGLKTGDKKSLDLQFPEDYVEDLKNKKVTFEVVIKEVTSKKTPSLSKEFFEDLNYENVTTKEELETKVKDDIKTRKESEINNKYIDLCLEKAAKNMEVVINEEIINDEIRRMIQQYEQQLQMQGMNIDTYYQMTGTTEEDLMKQMNPEAEKRIKFRYLLEEVAKVEKIEPTKKEVDERVEELATNYGITKEELMEAYGDISIIEYDLKMKNAIEIIKA